MFRALSGRPSPTEVSLQQKVEAGSHMVDSIKAGRAALCDELEATDSVRVFEADVDFIDGNAGDLYAGVVRGNYYIFVGAFAQEANFENMVRTVLNAGYLPTGFTFRSGMRGVAICPVNNFRDARYNLRSVYKEKFCPWDAYIMYVK